MERLIAALPELRPELHRYCARMAGSVIDGEDILQDALVRATEALGRGDTVRNIRPWLFRIAHNTALNHKRAAQRVERTRVQSAVTQQPSETPKPIGSYDLRPFLVLSPRQRSIILLHDLLGYAASEIAELCDTSPSAVKSALHRGRVRLRTAVSAEEPDIPPKPSPQEIRWLTDYASLFNNHEFDQLRDMLTEDIRLEVVARERRHGREPVGNYFSNYAIALDWRLVPGQVEGRPAAIVFDRDRPQDPPAYFILLNRENGRLRGIRDFRYARYVMACANWRVLAQ